MAKRPPKQADYKTQKAYWYEKLKQADFVDIERSEDSLKSYVKAEFSRRDNNRYHPDKIQAKIAYYIMAEHLLNDIKFKSRREEIIWEYHANGITIREIVKLLRKVKIRTNRDAVWKVIKRLREVMKTMYMSNGAGNG